MAKKNQTLGEFIIENQSDFQYSSGELSRLLNSIRLAAKVVNHEVNKAGLVDITGAAGDTNIQGEDQQKLDVYANAVFIQHGNYITVYQNISNVSVKKGDKVTTKQEIGSVAAKASSGKSILKFLVYQNDQKMNPASWIYKL